MDVLECIQDREEVKSCQNALVKALKGNLPLKEMRNLGHQGGYLQNEVHYSAHAGFWFSWTVLEDVGIPRYWNGFGIHRDAKSSDIVVEVNPPLEGVSAQVAGLFGKDQDGRRYLLHRGKVGGGRTGVGLNAFWDWYRGSLVSVATHEGETFDAVYVCCIDSSSVADDLYRFIREVKDFKDEVRGASNNRRTVDRDLPDILSYSPEHFGRKKGGARHISDHFSWHGKVVDALAERLSQRNSDDSIFNTQAVDLGVYGPQGVEAVYEVKTSCGSQSIYTGIGQLFFHTINLDVPTKVLVVPHTDLSEEMRSNIEATGIKLLTYRFTQAGVMFYE